MMRRDKLGTAFQLGPEIVADGDSDSLGMRGCEGARVIVTETAGGTADIQPQGSATNTPSDPPNWYPMGGVKALGANETWTRWIGEPNSHINVSVSNVVGASVRVEVQRFGA